MPTDDTYFQIVGGRVVQDVEVLTVHARRAAKASVTLTKLLRQHGEVVLDNTNIEELAMRTFLRFAKDS